MTFITTILLIITSIITMSMPFIIPAMLSYSREQGGATLKTDARTIIIMGSVMLISGFVSAHLYLHLFH